MSNKEKLRKIWAELRILLQEAEETQEKAAEAYAKAFRAVEDAKNLVLDLREQLYVVEEALGEEEEND